MKALWRNPLRALLTTLGVAIGRRSGYSHHGDRHRLHYGHPENDINAGGHRLGRESRRRFKPRGDLGVRSTVTLTPEDCEAILRECPAVVTATPLVYARTQVVYGNRNWFPTFMYGTTEDYLDIKGWLSQRENPLPIAMSRNRNGVCLLGQTVVRELF